MSARAVRFARSLALASASTVASAVVAGCGGAQTPSPSSAPASSASGAASRAPSATQVSNDEAPQSMPSDGPCRCSWDTNAQAAPRVCKKGEPNYEGTACVPGGGASYYGNKKYPMPVPGPLPPPELRARRGRGKPRSR